MKTKLLTYLRERLSELTHELYYCEFPEFEQEIQDEITTVTELIEGLGEVEQSKTMKN